MTPTEVAVKRAEYEQLLEYHRIMLDVLPRNTERWHTHLMIYRFITWLLKGAN